MTCLLLRSVLSEAMSKLFSPAAHRPQKATDFRFSSFPYAPKEALRYTLCGNGNMRNTTIYLNGKALTLGENDELPEMEGVATSGTIELAPGSCTFLVM